MEFLMHTKPLRNVGVLLAGLLWAGAFLPLKADFTEGMIARWTFNKSGEDAFRDDVHGALLAVQATPASRDLQISTGSDGTISVLPLQFLCAAEINSETYPRLKSSATVWVRLRLDEIPTDHTSFLFGLVNGKWPFDWKDVSLVVVHRSIGDEAGLRVFGNLENTIPFGQGKNPLPDKAKQFITVVLTFDRPHQTMSIMVDGELRKVSKDRITDLSATTGFALGHLNPSGGVALTVDEVRIYDSAVKLEWIEEITPVASETAK